MAKRTLHDVCPTMQIMSKTKIDLVSSEGIEVITNKKFTADEDERIRKNFKQFFKNHNIELNNEVKLMALGFFTSSKNREYAAKKKELRRYLIENDFYRKLGKGLENRQLFSIYRRARKILAPLRFFGDVSKNEKEEVVNKAMRTVLEHKNNWTELGEELNIWPHSVHEIVKRSVDQYGNAIKKGYFDLKEEIALVKGIIAETNIEDISNVLGVPIPWTKVKHHVNRRHQDQCRRHWSCLRNRIDTYVKPYLLQQLYYTDLDSARFIYLMYKESLKCESISDVDWDWIKSKFVHIGSLEKIIRWWTFLCSEVPGEKCDNHFTCVKWLCENTLPCLMKDTTFDELEEFYNS